MIDDSSDGHDYYDMINDYDISYYYDYDIDVGLTF